MSEIDKLVGNIKRNADGAKQSQIRFVECVSVDWDSKTMDAKGTGDGVDYLDVMLGFGYIDIKPAIGSLCLIGVIDGQDVVTFLINAEVVELAEIKATNMVYNGGDNFGLVKIAELTKKLNAIETEFNSLKSILTTWTPPMPPIIDNGAALKLAITPWTKPMQPTIQTEIEDTKITH